MKLIINLYVETTADVDKTWLKVHNLLKENGFKFLDATKFDPYTSGFNRVSTLEEIHEDLERTRG